MTSWILEVEGALNPEQRAVAEGLAAILERLNPPHLDIAGSTVVADTNGFHVTLLHSNRPELRVDVDASGGGEIVVSYGDEHEHFRSEDAEAGRVWPFPSEDHIQATLALVECLLMVRIELQVCKRPLGVKTRSYWINEDGQAELFLRGGTAGPYFGWSQRQRYPASTTHDVVLSHSHYPAADIASASVPFCASLANRNRLAKWARS